MNARQLIAALKPLEGKRITTLVQVSEEVDRAVTIECVKVCALPPQERMREDQGNVILWDGQDAYDGNPCGITLWARNVSEVIERPGRLVVRGKNGKEVGIQMVRRVEANSKEARK